MESTVAPRRRVCDGSDDFYPEERPVRRAAVDGFWIDERPVLVGEVRRLVKRPGTSRWLSGKRKYSQTAWLMISPGNR